MTSWLLQVQNATSLEHIITRCSYSAFCKATEVLAQHVHILIHMQVKYDYTENLL